MSDLEQLLIDDKPLTEGDLSTLTPEQLVEFRKKETEKIVALRQERRRVAEDAASKEKDFSQRFRNEQLVKAKTRFFAGFSDLKEEDKAKIEAAFAKIDSGHIDADLILGDLRQAYAAVNADSLLATKQHQDEMTRQAAEFNASQATPSGTGQPGEEKKYSDEAIAYVREARQQGVDLTLDEAESTLKRGMKRVYS
jgi:hypothetical protein